MRFKLLVSLGLVVLFVGVTLAWRSSTSRHQSDQTKLIIVSIDQPYARDVLPIEIIQPTVSSSAPNKLDDFRYIIRNKSTKAIIAAAIIKTINYEERGRLYAHSVYATVDAAFHPDMPGKPFLPGTQMLMESAGPVSFNEGVVIKEIRLTVEFASFDDHSAHGSGGEGERRINAMREGAREYKNWLAQKYSRAGKSFANILPLIQAPGVPQELKLNLDQTMGADRYRLNLLQTLKTKGSAEVESYLKENQ